MQVSDSLSRLAIKTYSAFPVRTSGNLNVTVSLLYVLNAVVRMETDGRTGSEPPSGVRQSSRRRTCPSAVRSAAIDDRERPERSHARQQRSASARKPHAARYLDRGDDGVPQLRFGGGTALGSLLRDASPGVGGRRRGFPRRRVLFAVLRRGVLSSVEGQTGARHGRRRLISVSPRRRGRPSGSTAPPSDPQKALPKGTFEMPYSKPYFGFVPLFSRDTFRIVSRTVSNGGLIRPC